MLAFFMAIATFVVEVAGLLLFFFACLVMLALLPVLPRLARRLGTACLGCLETLPGLRAGKVHRLSDAQWEQAQAHVRRWVGVGLTTGPADRARFEAGARRCHEHAQVPWHANVVWVSSPWILAIAGPIAAQLLREAGRRPAASEVAAALRALHGSVEPAALKAVQTAVEAAVWRATALPSADPVRAPGPRRRARARLTSPAAAFKTLYRVRQAAARAQRAHLAVRLRALVRRRVSSPVAGAVGGGLGSLLVNEVAQWLGDRGLPFRDCFIGQLEYGERSACTTAFYRDVVGVPLADSHADLLEAHEEMVRSACWWYPHRDFLLVCERPRELHGLAMSSGGIRLHRTDGPAAVWPDGFGVYALNGVRVPFWRIEPHRITLRDIEKARNAEVRRELLARYGWERYIRDCGAEVVDSVPDNHPIEGLRGARLLRKVLSGEPEPIVYLEMRNSTPEPDGTFARYLERIDPKAYQGDAGRLCHAAMASRWRHRDERGRLRHTFEWWSEYQPTSES